MKKIDGGIIAVTILCVFLGAIIGIQLKTVKIYASKTDNQRVSELSAQLSALKTENDNLSIMFQESQIKIEEYEKYLLDEDTDIGLVLEENTRLKMRSGLTNLAGRGVTITITDSKKAAQNPDSVNSDAFLVHAEDILSILNELNASGAEAISINGQRVLANSSVRCAGSVINIDDVKIAAPFIITAIGDPDVLEAALVFPGGVADS